MQLFMLGCAQAQAGLSIVCASERRAGQVLDDNYTLCLPNSERVKLDPEAMNVLFEVADLAAASPATISRCAMVHMPEDAVTWR